MTIRSFLSLVASVLVLTAAGLANANDQRTICRCVGIGWSDGYHSHAACPPKHCAIARPAPPPVAVKQIQMQKQKPIPWWMIPANGAEPVPAPAPESPSPPTSGQSLFRQPGEGTTVSAPTLRR